MVMAGEGEEDVSGSDTAEGLVSSTSALAVRLTKVQINSP